MSRSATMEDINMWTIIQIDTLASLMDASNGPWDPVLVSKQKKKSERELTLHACVFTPMLGSPHQGQSHHLQVSECKGEQSRQCGAQRHWRTKPVRPGCCCYQEHFGWKHQVRRQSCDCA